MLTKLGSRAIMKLADQEGGSQRFSRTIGGSGDIRPLENPLNMMGMRRKRFVHELRNGDTRMLAKDSDFDRYNAGPAPRAPQHYESGGMTAGPDFMSALKGGSPKAPSQEPGTSSIRSADDETHYRLNPHLRPDRGMVWNYDAPEEYDKRSADDETHYRLNPHLRPDSGMAWNYDAPEEELDTLQNRNAPEEELDTLQNRRQPARRLLRR